METSFIPRNFQQWHHCITVECGLELTPSYMAQRIESLQNNDDYYTQQFVKLYGRQHLLNVLAWFKEAQQGRRE